MFGKYVKFPVYRDDFIGFNNGMRFSLKLQFGWFGKLYWRRANSYEKLEKKTYFKSI